MRLTGSVSQDDVICCCSPSSWRDSVLRSQYLTLGDDSPASCGAFEEMRTQSEEDKGPEKFCRVE